ncbi:MAG: ATP synthase F1 subunit gamma [Holosporaceae bacterium]|jgi:F-type H+-transporting ATPase subunit gamma|nr:ATP synthase F1 subunit gamma [Holosporaceae bacterium]
MANLKEFRDKISVVQSIRKVTAAMKLVAGVKLKKAEQKARVSGEYAKELRAILTKLHRGFLNTTCELFCGRDSIDTHMLVVFASDKGLCGSFNNIIFKATREKIRDIYVEKKKVHLICVGIKLFDAFRHVLQKNDTIELADNFYKSQNLLNNSQELAKKIISDFSSHKIDRVSLIYTKCRSALSKEIEIKDIIPLECEHNPDKTETIFEPNLNEILQTIVPYNISVQLYQASLESIVGEQASRMTSMDNATRNADNMLSELKIKYNRTRQYGITQELVEVISGAAAIAKG